MTLNKNKEIKSLKTVEWKDNSLILIDQTKLPTKLVYTKCNDYIHVAKAIKDLVVRGAPAIGVAAAFGMALAAYNSKARSISSLSRDLDKAFEVIRSTRPTAVNLFWALDRVMKEGKKGKTVQEIKNLILNEARTMAEEDVENNRSMGAFGSNIISDGDVILTHCNAGSLATVAYGTALGVIRAAKESGKNIKVIATETRPVMQGARLTAFELHHDGIDVSLIPDTAVGHIMSKNKIKNIVVGADRVLKTGHVFNKIGTYQIALLAKAHKIPFYVVAPTSTFDLQNTPSDITIEERSREEVTTIGGKKIAPDGIGVFNPAFDMTPPELITGIITEKGILKHPFEKNIKKLKIGIN
ncbi:MAG: S-methyl-5-thioribose-1-phosphate isomerase [Nitrososphaeraceae archaeon]|nr:S-methyl-5-thioribose-1-phosphate isomerase [Nitrososphaeraceae archaeon]